MSTLCGERDIVKTRSRKNVESDAVPARTTRPAARGRDPTVTAVRHAIEILRGFSVHAPEQGISEIAQRVGLHKSSVSRLVGTLEQDHLLERDAATRRVRLGAGLISLAAPVLGNLRPAETARPLLAELARRSGETISFSVWDGAGAVSVEQALGGNAIAHYAPPGARNPAHCTASGKLLLAFAAPVDIDRTLAGKLERYTPRTVCDRARLRGELGTIRARGFALNAGEFAPDVGAVAAVVRKAGGDVVGAVTATVPMYRFDIPRQRELTAMVQDTALQVSKRLGFAG